MVYRSVLETDASGIVGSTPTAPTLENLVPIYGPQVKLRGPYLWKKNNRQVYDVHDGKKWKTCLTARLLLEIKLGRKLTRDETVDHIDDNPLNDSIDNLQVLSRSENAAKWHAKRPSKQYFYFTCPECNKSSARLLTYVKRDLKKGQRGPFCSRSCAGKYSSRQAKTVRGGAPNPNYKPKDIS